MALAHGVEKEWDTISLLGPPKWPGLELLGLLFSQRQKEYFCTYHSHLPKDTLHLPVFSNPISCGTLGKSSQRWKRKLLSKKVSYSKVSLTYQTRGA